MRRMYLVFAVILFLALPFLFAGCSGHLEERIVKNIVRIFWHENNRYSAMTREPGSNEISTVNFPECPTRVVVIADVPPNEPMWARIVVIVGKFPPAESFQAELVEIHIRTEKDVEGGGWNHGKFGSGSTHVIQ